MKRVYPLFLIIILFIFFLVINHSHNVKIRQMEEKFKEKIKQKENFIDSLNYKFDKLYNTIDSLPLGLPLDTFVLKDDFGVRKHPIYGKWQMHSGVDLIDTWRDTVYSTGAGVVIYARRNQGYGKTIKIQHAFSFTTKYAHLHKIFVKKDQNIKKGEAIGIMGATGHVTGQHLHYEISYNEEKVDPLPFLESSTRYVLK